MCGIIGYIGDRNASKVVKKGLSKLEYRGYDSAGVATVSEDLIDLRKDNGAVSDIFDETFDLAGSIGIGHTRWATHGEVKPENAHPHTDCDEDLAIVHNGIIENFEEIKNSLENHEFMSDTDSEVVAHFVEEHIKKGRTILESLRKFSEVAEGTYAVLLTNRNSNRLYALKHKSPLSVGVGEGENFIGSDIFAFSEYTDKALFLQDGDIAVVDQENITVMDRNGIEVERSVQNFDWTQKKSSKDEFDHYMLKEINEQPSAIKRLESSFENGQKEDVEKLKEEIEKAERVVFTAAGSSYHSSLMGSHFLKDLGHDSRAFIASEFHESVLTEDTLVVAVSQSGETMDVLETLEKAEEKGCRIASIVNVPFSSIQRQSDVSLEILAGQEICVASTKSFTNQILTMMKLAEKLGMDFSDHEPVERMRSIIEDKAETVEKIAEKLVNEEDIFILGRGRMYPVAREIALKLKEIAYVHAEGMRGGELKHGTLALIEDGTPVISLVPDKNSIIESNVKEVESRGAESIRISSEGDFEIDDSDLFPLLAPTIGFLLSYAIAKRKNLPIDKPRNLAKSVTVK